MLGNPTVNSSASSSQAPNGEGSTTILLGVHRKRGGSAEHLNEMEIWSELTGNRKRVKTGTNGSAFV